MKRRVILVGKSASGKDHARKVCQQWLGLTYQISYTTRPPRDEETDGVDYHFLAMREFNRMINEDKWYEYVSFNGWYYGTTRDQMEQGNSVFIMTPKGMEHLTPEDRKSSFVIYFDIDEELRKLRMGERGGNVDSVDRRIKADAIDFQNFTDYDAIITDPYYKIGDLYEIISAQMDLPHKDKFFTGGRTGMAKKYQSSI
jgi:guanylate kinase